VIDRKMSRIYRLPPGSIHASIGRMLKSLPVPLACLLAAAPILAAGDVLIVADEFPAMKALADRLKSEEGIDSRIVRQTELPSDLAKFPAVVVYIHRALSASAEKAMVDYTHNGGRLIALHHSISSGKRTNAHWLSFLGVELPKGDVSTGGYKWIEGVTIEVANLAPDHFVTTNKLVYPDLVSVASPDSGAAAPFPGIKLPESEVYLNHVLKGPRTILMGLKYTDATSGKVWWQRTAGWCKPAGKGWIFYFMPGHTVHEFENPAYARLVMNAVIWKPDH
jgi:hypothetical protein